MKVNVQYAENSLLELLPTQSEGEPDIPSQGAAKRGLWGAGKGEIWMAEDWDSPRTNEEIAQLFNDGPIDPGKPNA